VFSSQGRVSPPQALVASVAAAEERLRTERRDFAAAQTFVEELNRAQAWVQEGLKLAAIWKFTVRVTHLFVVSFSDGVLHLPFAVDHKPLPRKSDPSHRTILPHDPRTLSTGGGDRAVGHRR